MQSRSPRELSEAKTEALLKKFEQWGREHSDLRWPDALRRLAPLYALATRNLEPVDRAAARVLARAKTAFERGRARRSSAQEPRAAAAFAARRRKIAS